MSEGKKVEGQKKEVVSQSEDGGRTYELNVALALAKTLMKLYEAAKNNPAKREGLQKFDDLDPKKQEDFFILSRHHRVPQGIKDFIDGFGAGSKKFQELVKKAHEEDEKALWRDPEASEYFRRVGIEKGNKETPAPPEARREGARRETRFEDDEEVMQFIRDLENKNKQGGSQAA